LSSYCLFLCALDSKKPLPISFEALRTSLSEIPLNPNYYKFSGTQIYIEYGAVGPDGSLPVKYDFSSTKNGRKERRSIEGRIAVERRGTDSIAIQLFNLRQRLGSETKDLEDITVNFSRLSIEDIFRDRGSRSIPEGLDHAFRKLAIGERERDNTRDDTDYERYREKVYDRKEKGTLVQFEKDIGAVAEGLHTQTIVSAFTRAIPPKAHCISRALQLISDSGLQSQFPKEIYSHLCKTKFMVDTRSLPPANERITKDEATAEIERYMAIPGQALSYMVGKITILRMRAKYEKQLGAKFSLAEFHDQLLNGGNMPLGLLEKKLERWANGK
jgi:hypothetical protein